MQNNLEMYFQVSNELMQNDIVYCNAFRGMQAYESYKDNRKNMLNSEALKYCEIVNILEQIGFRENQIGTYLYASSIGIARNIIERNIDEKDGYRILKDVLLEMNSDKYSKFYFAIASIDGYDIGTTTYHSFVNNAFKDFADKNKIEFDDTLENDEAVYKTGTYAFMIASYLAQGKEKQEVVKKVRTYTKK